MRGESAADSEQVPNRRYSRRLTRYAVLSVVHLSIGLAMTVGLLSAWGWGLPFLLVTLFLLWAIGLYQVDVTLNAAFDETDRRRWRIALWCLPWSMTLYWLRHVRVARLAG